MSGSTPTPALKEVGDSCPPTVTHSCPLAAQGPVCKLEVRSFHVMSISRLLSAAPELVSIWWV